MSRLILSVIITETKSIQHTSVMLHGWTNRAQLENDGTCNEVGTVLLLTRNHNAARWNESSS